MEKYSKKRYFLSLSDRSKNKTQRDFLELIDQLFIEDITFEEFIEKIK